MVEKKPDSKKSANRIPEMGTYLREADPGDPTSRPMFTPGKLSLDKADGGMFKVRIPGMNKVVVTKDLEAVFLVSYPESECRCTTKADTKSVVCRSYDRRYSTKGFKCAGECPYEEFGVEKTAKRYKRPLRKRTFLLVREAGTKNQFILVKYESTLDNIKNVESVKNYFHGVLRAAGEERPFPSNNIALITAETEKIDKTVFVAVIGSKPVKVDLLTPEEAESVYAISKGLLDLNNDFMKKYKETTEALYKELVAKGLAGISNAERASEKTEAKEESEPNDAAEKSSAASDKSTARSSDKKNKTESAAKETLAHPDSDAEDEEAAAAEAASIVDDEDTPF